MATFQRRADVLEHTTVTGGVVVLAVVVEAWDIMKILKRKDSTAWSVAHIHSIQSSKEETHNDGSNRYVCYELRGKWMYWQMYWCPPKPPWQMGNIMAYGRHTDVQGAPGCIRGEWTYGECTAMCPYTSYIHIPLYICMYECMGAYGCLCYDTITKCIIDTW